MAEREMWLTELIKANVEALARDETSHANGPGETVYCASHMYAVWEEMIRLVSKLAIN